jgi:uncharacterized membrane protein
MSDTPAAPARRWTWRDVLLVASLAINLAVLGIVAAQYMRKERAVRLMGPAYNELLPRAFVQALPEARRAEVVAAMRDSRRDFREQRRELRAAALKVADALDAEPFDAAGLDRAVDAYRAEVGDLVTQGTGFALATFRTLSPPERKLVAEKLRQRARR